MAGTERVSALSEGNVFRMDGAIAEMIAVAAMIIGWATGPIFSGRRQVAQGFVRQLLASRHRLLAGNLIRGYFFLESTFLVGAKTHGAGTLCGFD